MVGTQINSDDELELVEELKNRLKRLLTDDQYDDNDMLIKFLRARNHDLKASENMLRNNLNWRKNHEVDTIGSWYKVIEIEQYVPFSQMCFDRDGCLVVYFDFGIDLRGILKSVSMSVVTNYIIKRLEDDMQILREQTKRLNKKIDQWIYVVNFENFSLASATHKPTMECIGKMCILYDANYPEMMKNAYIINTSWIFQIGFNFVKPLISKNTLDKFKIYGKDGWKEDLLKAISAEELPSFLGGNRTDPDGDPMCSSKIKHAAEIPERFFATTCKNNFAKQPGVRKLTIRRLSKEKVEVIVIHPESVIEWEFFTKSKDIAFSLVYKQSSNSIEEKEVLESQRCDTPLAPESGLYRCKQPGIYYLVFDNSYSWIRSKELYYKFKVAKSQESNK